MVPVVSLRGITVKSDEHPPVAGFTLHRAANAPLRHSMHADDARVSEWSTFRAPIAACSPRVDLFAIRGTLEAACTT
jgi:hypothetical protein